MEWIKVTDRLPPDMEPVIVSVRNDDGSRSVNTLAWYNKTWEEWECVRDPGQCVVCDGVDGTVTHWMPYPEPAED